MNPDQHYEIREVTDAATWRMFLKLPWKIYRDDIAWVAPLIFEQRKLTDKKKNPFFKHAASKAWVICKNGQTEGRILAYIDDRYNEHYQDQTGFFGFFECVDNHQAASILFGLAAEWVKQMGMKKLRGPVNFDIANECGILLSGFEFSPCLQMGHNPPYYCELFEQFHFSKAHDLLAYRLRKKVMNDKPFVEKLKSASERILSAQDIRFRRLQMKSYPDEMFQINDLYNEFMNRNWGFIPVTTEEMMYAAESLKQIVDPELVFFAEKKDQVAGCSISLPDVNQALHHLNGRLFPFGIFRFLYFRKKITRVRLILLGVKKEFRHRGLDILFYYHTMKKVFEGGYDEAELSWISEDNDCLISIVQKFGAELYKKYRVYEKCL